LTLSATGISSVSVKGNVNVSDRGRGEEMRRIAWQVQV
jgi:hypothetical protein